MQPVSYKYYVTSWPITGFITQAKCLLQAEATFHLNFDHVRRMPMVTHITFHLSHIWQSVITLYQLRAYDIED